MAGQPSNACTVVMFTLVVTSRGMGCKLRPTPPFEVTPDIVSYVVSLFVATGTM